jgi:hypothetical protein
VFSLIAPHCLGWMPDKQCLRYGPNQILPQYGKFKKAKVKP